MNEIIKNREIMKTKMKEHGLEESDFDRKIPKPSSVKYPFEGSKIIDLIKVDQSLIEKMTEEGSIKKNDIFSIINDRKSRRNFNDQSITLDELSFLLWATQGIKEVRGSYAITFRTVPSGGSLHAFETYLVIQRVEGLEAGVYHYLPLTHQLELIFTKVEKRVDLKKEIIESTLGQKWAGTAAVTFFWSAIPYRSEWKYKTHSHKIMLLDAGHVCQNLYLACESIGSGVCAIDAYDQKYSDDFIGLDGLNEFVVYIAGMGRV